MNKLNKEYANILITIGILKIMTLIVFGISQFTLLNSNILNIIKLIINILEPTILSLNIIMIILNIKTKRISGYLLSYLAPLAEYIIPQSTMVLLAKTIVIGYIYILSGKLIKKASNQKEKPPTKTKIFIITIYLLILTLLTILKVFTSTITYLDRNIEMLDTLEDISKPIQQDYEETFIINKNFENIYLDAVATYEITGRVTNTHHYRGFDKLSKISPVDVSMSWGKTANKKINKEIRYSSIGDRKVYTRIPYDIEYNNNEISNNHLIPSNSKIKKQLELISIGDYLKIEGKLVNVRTENWFTKTSTYRDDTGEGACEIIYVTKIIWLKEK